MATKKTQEVAEPNIIPQYDVEKLGSLTSWGDVADLLESSNVQTLYADQVAGDGFTLLSSDDKAKLIGVPMVLLEWRFNNGAQGRFVSVRAVAKTGVDDTDVKKVIFNDGSTGILQQLTEITEKTSAQGGLIVRKGLRVSQYTYEDEKGVERPAETYYLDTSL